MPVITLADIDSVWPLAEALATKTPVTVEKLGKRLPKVPSGPWTDPPHTAVVVPIRSSVPNQLSGFLVAGVSPRLRLDEHYQSFLELVAAQIATAVNSARAYEEERQRAEALAALDIGVWARGATPSGPYKDGPGEIVQAQVE